MGNTWEVHFRGRVRGPISDGRIHQHVDEYSEDVARELADTGEEYWLSNLHTSIRVQTPYYTTRVTVRRLAASRYMIHDRGVIYGPWLESGEYTPRTRFTGYFSLERAQGELRGQRRNIARRILRQHRARGRLT